MGMFDSFHYGGEEYQSKAFGKGLGHFYPGAEVPELKPVAFSDLDRHLEHEHWLLPPVGQKPRTFQAETDSVPGPNEETEVLFQKIFGETTAYREEQPGRTETAAGPRWIDVVGGIYTGVVDTRNSSVPEVTYHGYVVGSQDHDDMLKRAELLELGSAEEVCPICRTLPAEERPSARHARMQDRIRRRYTEQELLGTSQRLAEPHLDSTGQNVGSDRSNAAADDPDEQLEGAAPLAHTPPSAFDERLDEARRFTSWPTALGLGVGLLLITGMIAVGIVIGLVALSHQSVTNSSSYWDSAGVWTGSSNLPNLVGTLLAAIIGALGAAAGTYFVARRTALEIVEVSSKQADDLARRSETFQAAMARQAEEFQISQGRREQYARLLDESATRLRGIAQFARSDCDLTTRYIRRAQDLAAEDLEGVLNRLRQYSGTLLEVAGYLPEGSLYEELRVSGQLMASQEKSLASAVRELAVPLPAHLPELVGGTLPEAVATRETRTFFAQQSLGDTSIQIRHEQVTWAHVLTNRAISVLADESALTDSAADAKRLLMRSRRL